MTAEPTGRPVVGWRQRLELLPLLGLVGLVGAFWGFIELADLVQDGETLAIDKALLLALRDPADPARPLGPGWVQEIGRDVTALGGLGLLTFLTLAVAGYMALLRRYRTVLLLALSVGGGILVSTVLKNLFDRPRPDLVPHGSITYTASFPSGHSMMAAVTFLTLGALLARVQRNRLVKSYLIGLAILVTVAVGISRVYLGVHWPTDVLAGWTVGATWAAGVWLLARWLQLHHKIEEEPEGGDSPGGHAGR